MTTHGFCQHGKLWTTCADCGKDVIRSHAGRRPASDDFIEAPRPVKRVVKSIPREPPDDAAFADE